VRAGRRSTFGALGLVSLLFMTGSCGIHTDYFETRAFEVTVDLTAEGQRMQITRTIECEPWRRREAGLIPYTQWRAKTESFGQRLPSGAAVMIVTPSFCRSAYRKEGSSSDELPVSKGHIPYIGWADNADNPTVVEAYISPEYFKQPYARVIYHGMSARIVPSSSIEPGKKDGFEWFRGPAVGQRPNAYAVFAQSIPMEKWKSIPDVAQYVRTVDKVMLLPSELAFKYGGQFSLIYGQDRVRNGLGLPSGPSPDWTYDKGHNQDTTRILPILRRDDHFIIDPSKRGFLTYYRLGELPGAPSRRIMIDLQIGDDRISLPVGNSLIHAVYDPNSRTIFRFWAGELLTFPK
jgi:hypothetical protein